MKTIKTLFFALLLMLVANASAVVTAPTAAPAVPTHASENVISVYSDTYTSIATNTNPGWGQGTAATEEDFAGNKVLKYANLDYQGLEYTNSNVAGMQYLHLDYWTADATAFQFFLISTGPLENGYDIAASDGITLGQWVSVDIPITEYTAPELDKVFQFKTVGNGTIYLDNLYFWRAPVAQDADATLSDLKVDGTTISDFDADKISYTHYVSSTTVPTTTATVNVSGANVNITDAASIPGTTTVVVTATDGTTQKTYSIEYKQPVVMPLDFESSDLAYTWGEFGAPTNVIDNPQKSGINMSDKVSQIVKNAGNDWNGSYVFVDTPFDLNSTGKVTAKFFSTRVGINMMMKLEQAGGAATAEIQVPTTVANEWETLTFDFSGGLATDFTKIVIICDRATVGDGSADHTYLVDDIALYVAPADNEAPTAFTATKGEVTHNSVEFLLNATDNSGSVTYTIEYGSTSVETTGNSGEQTSYVLTGLDQETTYNFSVSAKDEADNVATNNPIAISATTGVSNNTACNGTDTEAHEGEFTNGYTYDFVTSGTDVTLTFKLLDDKVGIVAFLHNVTDGFEEIGMTGNNTDGFSATLNNQVSGTNLSFRCKFAFAGGLAITKTFTYKVGDTCGVASQIQETIQQEIAVISKEGALQVQTAEPTAVSIYAISGQKVLSAQCDSRMDVSLNRGIYIVKVGNQTIKSIVK